MARGHLPAVGQPGSWPGEMGDHGYRVEPRAKVRSRKAVRDAEGSESGLRYTGGLCAQEQGLPRAKPGSELTRCTPPKL